MKKNALPKEATFKRHAIKNALKIRSAKVQVHLHSLEFIMHSHSMNAVEYDMIGS